MSLTLTEEKPFLMVVKGEQIVDLDLVPDDSQGSVGYFTPIIGVKHATQVEYDRQTDSIFWVELDAEDSDNVS